MASSKTPELTDFSIDILGRYMCNGLDEALHSTDKNAQAQALRFVIHFVGDIHKPLHCTALVSSANPKGDQGEPGMDGLAALVQQSLQAARSPATSFSSGPNGPTG